MKNKIFVGIVVALLLAILYFSNTKLDDSVLKIGFIGNLTGQYSEYTVNFREGVELARDVHNKSSSVKTEIVYEDDSFESKKGMLAFQKLVGQDGIRGLINVTTPTIGVIKSEINKKHLPTIQFGIEPDGSQDDYVFTVYPGGIGTEQKVAKEVQRELGICTNPLLVYSQVEAMISQKDFFKKGYAGNLKEYVLSNQLESIKGDSLKVYKIITPDCIVMQTTPLDGAHFIKNYLLYSRQMPKFFFSSIFYPAIGEYQKVLGNNMSKIGNSLVPIVDTYAADEFKKLFKEKHGREPGAYAEFGFDAFQVLVNAYEADTGAWIQHIQSTDLKGVSSHITYTDTGSVDPEIVVKKLSEMAGENGS